MSTLTFLTQDRFTILENLFLWNKSMGFQHLLRISSQYWMCIDTLVRLSTW